MVRYIFCRSSAPASMIVFVLVSGFSVGNLKAESLAGLEARPIELEYRSVFVDYQSYQDQPVLSWRDANDTVARIGGWRAYAREVGDAGESSEQNERFDDNADSSRHQP